MKPATVLTWVAAPLLAAANVSQAQPYRWGPPGAGPSMPPPGYLEPYGVRDPREGKIQVQTFVANSPAVATLGHGAIVVTPAAGGQILGPEQGAYEAALADQLARAGYQNSSAAGNEQTIEFSVVHELVQPPEPPHNPVSGGAAVGGGNRGSGFGLGLSIDLSKPLRALVATTLEARILDSGTKELLWQGRAEVLAREGDRHWTDQAIAQRLAAALFKGFPRPI